MLWNQNVHYRVNNSPPPVAFLIQVNSVHILPSYLFMIYANVILPSTPMSS